MINHNRSHCRCQSFLQRLRPAVPQRRACDWVARGARRQREAWCETPRSPMVLASGWAVPQGEAWCPVYLSSQGKPLVLGPRSGLHEGQAPARETRGCFWEVVNFPEYVLQAGGDNHHRCLHALLKISAFESSSSSGHQVDPLLSPNIVNTFLHHRLFEIGGYLSCPLSHVAAANSLHCELKLLFTAEYPSASIEYETWE